MDAMVTAKDRSWPVRWNEQVCVRDDVLSAACGAPLERIEGELLGLAGLVAYADRVCRRAPTRDGWERPIHVRMPVEDPVRWNAPGISSTLSDCLRYVTGDAWTFEFVRGSGPPIQMPLGPRRSPRRFDAVVPFSGGLDSFMLWRHLQVLGETPLLMTARTTALIRRHAHEVAQTAPRGSAGADLDSELGLPIRWSTGAHAEPSFRTRTFIFATASSVAARLVGAQRVAIAENGQGSVGAGIVPFGSEFPYRTTHPVFSAKFARFLRALLGESPRFEHPFLWRTKGSVLSELIARGAGDAWESTVSCSRDLKRHKQVPDERACGICGNCMLRRVSVHAAGAQDRTRYHWRLNGRSLHQAEEPGAQKPTTETDRAYAARNVLAMDSFATVRDDAPALRGAALAISEWCDEGDFTEVRRKLIALRNEHAREWGAFLAHLPADSWVFEYTETAHV